MKKITTLLLLSSFITIFAFSQTGQGCWLAGGSAGFSSSKEHDHSSTAPDLKTSTFAIAPDFGYFFIDNLAGGINLTYLSIHTTESGFSSSASSFSTGPFVRYYFGISKTTKIFVHGSIEWGSQGYGSGNPSESLSTYEFKAGPAFFLNPHVALELTAGYQSSKSKSDYTNYTTTDFMIGAGFQIHLGKGK